MAESDRGRLRQIFDEDAELYDQARPAYPAALFQDLAELAGVRPGCRVLEIGCGTGQATLPLAEMGCEIVAVELGTEMARVARRNLARFPLVEVVTAAFEDWPLPARPFDVVFCATAFHWIDPAVRVVKSAAALRPGGTLATVTTHHVLGGTVDFFVAVQDCYERFDPATPPGLRLSPAAGIPVDGAEIEESPRFGAPVFRRHEWDVPYTTAQYVDVLSTYSNHRDLPPDALAGLLGCVASLIDGHHDGHVTKRYMAELRVARRLP